MRAALPKIRSAFQAAVMPIGTIPLWFPSVGTELDAGRRREHPALRDQGRGGDLRRQ